jgi:DNA-binding transcriptional LysR family regulator
VTLSAPPPSRRSGWCRAWRSFRADLPHIDLRIQTADRDLDLAWRGHSAGEFAAAIRRTGRSIRRRLLAAGGNLPGLRPGLSGRARACRKRHRILLDHQLIHLEEPFRSAATWRDWFASAARYRGRRVPKGLQINDYVLVIQSVIAGQGIALGWQHLVEGLVEDRASWCG